MALFGNIIQKTFSVPTNYHRTSPNGPAFQDTKGSYPVQKCCIYFSMCHGSNDKNHRLFFNQFSDINHLLGVVRGADLGASRWKVVGDRILDNLQASFFTCQWRVSCAKANITSSSFTGSDEGLWSARAFPLHTTPETRLFTLPLKQGYFSNQAIQIRKKKRWIIWLFISFTQYKGSLHSSHFLGSNPYRHSENS